VLPTKFEFVINLKTARYRSFSQRPATQSAPVLSRVWRDRVGMRQASPRMKTRGRRNFWSCSSRLHPV
jgi:hypothetical protein